MLRIYLAGPQVFRPDAVRYGQQLKEACLASGFVGLFPLDNALPDGLSRHSRRSGFTRPTSLCCARLIWCWLA